ncbi:MAG: ATP phosphoribosyltransferase regulatory subunit [Candidatus Rokubacteria bacterium]|nr:ATP phosphoribosyltransferase regulatory subunit [Candidatus Rokubacteria bacterium]
MDRRAIQSQLPKGAKIYLPDEAAKKRFVEERLLRVFSQWGFREVVTPTYEYFDVLSLGTDTDLQERMFKFGERETGRMLALRADITPQIARIVATRLRDEPKPIRLAYVQNVFRYHDPEVGRYREFYQAGVELVGLEKPEADAEMIAMAVEGLRVLGLSRFQINVGQADFFRGVLEELRIDRVQGRQLQDALSRKDASTLEQLVRQLAPPASTAELLLALPSLFGREEVLERAGALVKNRRSERALANLAEVHRLLRVYGLADSIILDRGEVRGFDYYSGVHFEGYVEGLGADICGGGRYDHMLARFGFDCPATGFAFDVGRLLLVMEAQGAAVPLPGPDFFIIDFTPEKTAALALSRRLRDLGASVARDIITRPLEESLAYAARQRCRWVLVVGSPKTRPDEVWVRELATGQERVLAAKAILDQPAVHFPLTPPSPPGGEDKGEGGGGAHA